MPEPYRLPDWGSGFCQNRPKGWILINQSTISCWIINGLCGSMCYKTSEVVPKFGIEHLQLHIKFLKTQNKNWYTQTRMTLQRWHSLKTLAHNSWPNTDKTNIVFYSELTRIQTCCENVKSFLHITSITTDICEQCNHVSKSHTRT
jgi:hypothetical protein